MSDGSPGASLTPRQRLTYVLVLGALTALGPFTIDMYLPAFPAIETEFGVDPTVVQLTLTGTMVGFAAGQLIVGPLSDRVGRKVPLVAATLLHIAASLGAALAPTILWLGVLRVLQGFGAASSSVVSMAMVRDLFGGRHLIQMMSRLALVNGFAPVIAPVVGSQLLAIMSWRGIFWVLAVYGTIMSVTVIVFIRETHLPEVRKADTRSLASRYSALFHDRIYLGMVAMAGLNFTGLFAYLSASPFLFQQVYGMTEQQYGFAFAINSLAVIAGVQTVSRLIHRGTVAPQWVLVATTGAQMLLGSVILVLSLTGAGMWGTLIPLWFFILACGFTFPTVQYLAMANHGAEAGTAASVLGAVNFGLAGALSPIIGVLGVGTARPMAGMMVVAAAVSATVLWTVIRPRSLPSVV